MTRIGRIRYKCIRVTAQLGVFGDRERQDGEGMGVYRRVMLNILIGPPCRRRKGRPIRKTRS